MKNSNSSPRPFLSLLLAMLMATVVLSGCKGGKEPTSDEATKTEEAGKDGKEGEKKPEAVPVEVVSVGRQAITASYAGTANLEAPGESQEIGRASCRERV